MYSVGNFKETYLANPISDSDLTMDVSTGSGVSMPDTPCLAIITKSRSLYDLKRGEIIKVTTKNVDEFTIERGFSGTTPAAHTAGKLIMFNIFAENITSISDLYTQLTKFVAYSLGAGDTGIIRTTYDPCTDLQVVQAGTPNMTVKVKVGNAMIAFTPVTLANEWTSGTIVAPAGGNSRIDLVQINNEGTLSIKTGTPSGSPSAQTVDTDNISLATILLITGQTSIVTGDITDVRSFY